MKPRFYPLFLLLPLLAASCVRIMTSSTTYNHFLDEETRARVVFLGDSAVASVRAVYDSAAHKPFLLINGKQLRDELHDSDTTLVWIFLPGCPTVTETPKSFTAYAEAHGLPHWIVLTDMNGNAMVNAVDRYFMVGIDFRHYDSKFRHTKLFFTDLLGGTLREDVWNQPGSIYVFHGKEVVRVVSRTDEL